MSSKYRVNDVVDFQDVNAAGYRFNASGPIKEVLGNGWYAIVNKQCEPHQLCEVPESDITKVHRKSVKGMKLILVILAALALLMPFIGNINDSRFIFISCIAAAIFVFSAVIILVRGGSW